jgi:hypothetical protein
MFAAAAVPRSGTGPAMASRGVHTCKRAKGQLMEHMQTAFEYRFTNFVFKPATSLESADFLILTKNHGPNSLRPTICSTGNSILEAAISSSPACPLVDKATPGQSWFQRSRSWLGTSVGASLAMHTHLTTSVQTDSLRYIALNSRKAACNVRHRQSVRGGSSQTV